VDLNEIRVRLDTAMKLRVPQFDPNTRAAEKIDRLEDHLLLAAFHRAEVEEALHWAIEAGKRLRDQWDRVEGYEPSLPPPSRRTKEDVDRAKARIDPQLWTSIQDCRTLVESLRRQSVRLGGSDYDAVSRVYTLISGPS
jgi:hypothetical protein